MSVLVRRLDRLRGAYPVLLRLGYDSRNHPRTRIFNALARRKRSILSATCIDSKRSQGPGASSIAEDDVDDNDGPKKISENIYAHNLFLNSLKYTNTVMQPSTTYARVTNQEAQEILMQDWSSMPSVEMVSGIKKLSYNISHSNDRKLDPFEYMKAFNRLNLQNLSNEDLMTAMRHLVPFSRHMARCYDEKNENFYNKLCERIDNECLTRFLRLPADKMLYLCDVLYQMMIRFQKYDSQYIWYAVRNLGNKPQRLSPQQLIQIMFFLNVYRKPPVNMYELEFRLEQCMDDLSINELAIAALGFFKTKSKIKNEDFLNRIFQRTINEIDLMDSVSIAAIVKLIRYSMTLSQIYMFQKLMKVLTPREPRYTLMSLAHIAQACGRIMIYEKEFMDRVMKRLNKEVKTARLKDFERLLYTFSTFNINSNVYQNVIEELRATWNTTRVGEIAKYPHAASRIFGYLTTQNMYPVDLIKYVMAPEYINKMCYGNYHYLSREYCMLDYGLQIEVPEYDGPFLKPKIRSYLEKKYYELGLTTGSGESTRANLLFTDVLTTCQELFNTTSDISAVRVLPHIATQDIVFCMDEQNQLMPSEKFLSQFESSEIKRVDKKNDVRWIALVMGHRGLLIRNYNTPTGALAAKIRQLSIIGYTPFMISHVLWETYKPQEKRDYIKKLVFRDNASK